MDIQEAQSKFEEMRNNNVPLMEISREIGISMATIRRWESERQKAKSQPRKTANHDEPAAQSFEDISLWNDLSVVMGRLTIGIAACFLLLKAVGFIKMITLFLSGAQGF